MGAVRWRRAERNHIILIRRSELIFQLKPNDTTFLFLQTNAKARHHGLQYQREPNRRVLMYVRPRDLFTKGILQTRMINVIMLLVGMESLLDALIALVHWCSARNNKPVCLTANTSQNLWFDWKKPYTSGTRKDYFLYIFHDQFRIPDQSLFS